MKNYFVISILALSMSGCAGLTNNAPKVLGSACATSGAYMSAIALRGSNAQVAQALKDAAVLTPVCSASTPATAETTAVATALASLASMAAPYMIQPTTGATKS